MSDLGHRVAAVLATHQWNRMGGCDCGIVLDTFWTTHVAEAVIDAIGLQSDWGCATAGHHGCRCSHRYVTDWKADDE